MRNVIPSFFPNLVDDRQKSPGRGHFDLVRAFAAGQPFVKAAQVKIHLNPLSISWGLAPPPVRVPDLINLYSQPRADAPEGESALFLFSVGVSSFFTLKTVIMDS